MENPKVDAHEKSDGQVCSESGDGLQQRPEHELSDRQKYAADLQKSCRADTFELSIRGVLPPKPAFYDSSKAALLGDYSVSPATHDDRSAVETPEDAQCRDRGYRPGEEPAPDAKPVSVEYDDKNRPVREKMSSGPDVVLAYDDQGNPHRFLDKKIEKLPPDFASVPEWRRQQLDRDANKMIDERCKDGTISFSQISDMMQEIAKRKDLTEVEKCSLFDLMEESVRRRHGATLEFDDRDENPKMIDSWQGSEDPWHAFAPLSDPRHNRLVNMPPEQASKEIFDFEDHEENSGITWKLARAVFGRNQGDIDASEGQLKAMRQLREKGTFQAYADEWDRQMVRRVPIDTGF